MTRRTARRAAAAVLGTVVGMAGLVAQAAPAAAEEEIPEFSFATCPELPEGAQPGLWLCTIAKITSGRLTLGGIDQEIHSPITIVYANGFDPITFEETVIVESLESEPIRVEGGILGIPGSDFLPIMQIHAQPQLAGELELSPEPGVQMRQRMKIGVKNPLLGDTCTIGTDEDPITLDLGFGPTNPPPPNEPITGATPVDVSTDPWVVKSTMVDNAFAVPKSANCGPFGWFNGIVDWQSGLPAAAGKNTAIFDVYSASKGYTELGAA
ncbi:hypothetical protein GCM10010182_38570 [Actinomadura cremea]|nr:hypothetical protein GCM10010182_38570 [Actinomadura cremea]